METPKDPMSPLPSPASANLPISKPYSPKHAHSVPSSPKSTRHESPSSPMSSHNSPSASEMDDSSASEAEIIPYVPRGRMAARLMGVNAQTTSNAGPNSAFSTTVPTALNTKTTEDDSDDESPVKKPGRLQRSTAHDSSLSTPPKPVSEPVSRRSSPGLFVSPGPSHHSGSESDIAVSNVASKLQKLASRKSKDGASRKKQTKSKKSKASGPASGTALEDLISSDHDQEDQQADEQMTQKTRPSRKASKKALEELHRETQRMSRNQQLAHQAMVKRKITKQDLFARFNFKPINSPATEKQSEDELTMSGALVSSDTEQAQHKDTPPTSPASVKSLVKLSVAPEADVGEPALHDDLFDVDDDLPDIKELFARARESKLAPSLATAAPEPKVASKPSGAKKQFRIVPPASKEIVLDDSDDELEIVKPKAKATKIFDALPANRTMESVSLMQLRHLANLTSPSKKRGKGKGLTLPELQQQLKEKARQQAIKDKEERIAELRARGVVIQTMEEREQEQLEFETLLERARVEAADIAKKEKAAAKKEGKQDGDLPDDDDDDEDWDGEDEDEASEAELSGSEDEVEADEDDAEHPMPLFDNEADESAGEDSEEKEVWGIFQPKPPAAKTVDEIAAVPVKDAPLIESTPEPTGINQQAITETVPESETDDEPVAAMPRARPSLKRRVVEDDEDEEALAPPTTLSGVSPGDKARAAFGFLPSSAAAGGLSQAFAGTLGLDSQEDSQVSNLKFDPDQDSMALLDHFPGSKSDFDDSFYKSKLMPNSQLAALSESVPQEPTLGISLGISQFPSQFEDTQISPVKMSQFIELTQDAGFAAPREPAGKQQVPPSTVDTLVLATQETPVRKPKGRLIRRKDMAMDSEDEDMQPPAEAALGADSAKDAFNVLSRGAKKAANKAAFDKKKSAAKELFEEQAEESEDEYAGLGGASDDESNGEMDEEMQRMMDDGHVDVNENAVAAFHAEKERQADEKQINKLYKDVTTGLLRKKRGAAGFDDLDDSDDDGAERRRRKQEEFARMRRALLEDEKIGKIAQNPKQQAFFHALEDRDDFESQNFLDDPTVVLVPDTQPDEQKIQPEHAPSPSSMKRKLPDDFVSDDKENVPPARHPRRTTAAQDAPTKRPTSLAEIRESLSFLVDEPFIPDSQPTLDFNDEDDDPFNLIHENLLSRSDTISSETSRTSSVVNRLSRTNTADSESAQQPMAFQAGGKGMSSIFKVPSLLRRATNLSTTSNSSSTSSGSGEKSGMRLGGSKKSNMHAQAREAERRLVLDAAEKKRKEHVKKTVLKSLGRSIFGILRKGNSGFE
ncbi:hypothetical protein BT63DRAFT_436414 [Microthyrium microscopicum]|uniref:DNA replication checkpoint mediator MRC1 domain-containing protein n=1 Tax=Microthyrium microscopicum TaxID=703497 RepID=A0A6A6UT77_9PEZI|nr:hypothetical protein BT63DRAFT_436414 [Microthyrium microscopicum]